MIPRTSRPFRKGGQPPIFHRRQPVPSLCAPSCENDPEYQRPIEMVKVRQRINRNEPGIQDPFLVFPCDPAKPVCEAEADDPDYAGEDRTVFSCVRVVQQETPPVKTQGPKCRCENGACVEMNPRLAGPSHGA